MTKRKVQRQMRMEPLTGNLSQIYSLELAAQLHIVRCVIHRPAGFYVRDDR